MADGLMRRNEVPDEARWNVEAIYPSPEEWERDFENTASFPKMLLQWSGRLDESPDTLRRAVESILACNRLLEKLKTYAAMRMDEDLSSSVHSDMVSRITSRMVDVETAVSFFTPELLSIEKNRMDEWLASEALAPYRSWLEEILRFRPHTLGRKEEELLAGVEEIIGCFGNAFGKLSNVDMPARMPEIEDGKGAKVRLTNGNFNLFLRKRDRNVRREAFSGFYGEVRGNVATKASLLEGQVRSQVWRARARNFGSALEASLFSDRVDPSVYDSLIGTVHDNLDVLHRYFALRADVLDLDPARIYDVHLPVVPASREEFTWEEAVDLTLESVSVLGDEYTEKLSRGLNEGWVDRYENVSKRSGAYSGGCYDSMPYILHNFNGTLSSVFTLAHEAGHSMHSLLSRQTQPYHTADYRILVAEVASTANELLLMDLLMRKMEDAGSRAFLLDHLLGQFKSTLARQTMFAEFEKTVHSRVESGGSLTPDYLDETYYGLVKLYHGGAFRWDAEDEPIASEWSRIPHFYYGFYVYKYATGLSAAVDISSRILGGEDGEVEGYLEFLRSGSSEPPLELLKRAGVDLSTPVPVGSAMAKMADTLDRLERTLRV